MHIIEGYQLKVERELTWPSNHEVPISCKYKSVYKALTVVEFALPVSLPGVTCVLKIDAD